MLPYDNKSELQVVIDMPEGTTLEATAAAARELAVLVRTRPEVADVEVYAGTSAPFNFNGLVRHYFLRSGPLVADLQVNLLPKDERGKASHTSAKEIRNLITPAAQRLGANVKVTEVPPGPPVLSTMVAEVYGPDPAHRIALAKQVRGIFESTPGVVDTDWLVEDASPKLEVVDRPREGHAERRDARGRRQDAPDRARRDGRGPPPRGRRPRAGADRPEARPRPALRPRGPPRDDRAVHDDRQARPGPRARDRHGRKARAVHLPQEPAARDVRPRRDGGRRRGSRLRHPRHEDEDRGAPRARRQAARDLQHVAPDRLEPLRAEVGRRVARHGRGLPRHGDRVRRRPRPHLRPRRGLVPLVRDAAHHHGADPAHADRHPARRTRRSASSSRRPR